MQRRWSTHHWVTRCSRCYHSSFAAGHRSGVRCSPSAKGKCDRVKPRDRGGRSITTYSKLLPNFLSLSDEIRPRVCPGWGLEVGR